MKITKSFRIDESRLKMLENICNFSGMNMTQVIEALILNEYILLKGTSRNTEEHNLKWKRDGIQALDISMLHDEFQRLVEKEFLEV